MAQHLPRLPENLPWLDKYLEGSREEDLKRIILWLDNPKGDDKMALWIQGPAGIGKSMLAEVLGQHLGSESRNQLAAAVFLGAFSSAEVGILTVDHMVKMIAHQIGTAYPAARQKIVENIESPGALSQDLPRLFEQCILNPLNAVRRHGAQTHRPFVIIVDGLDEWALDAEFVTELVQLNLQSSLLKFVLLSRNDPSPIESNASFDLDPVDSNTLLARQDLSEAQTNLMKAYMTRRLHHIASPGEDKQLNDHGAERLALISHGHFQWASIATSLLSQNFLKRPRREVLEEIIVHHQNQGKDACSETRMQILYQQGIQILFADKEERRLMRQYIRFILILQEPISWQGGARLVRPLSLNEIRLVQAKLSFFQIRQQLNIRQISPAKAVFHSSFVQYLQSLDSESDSDQSSTHEQIGRECLDLLANFDPDILPPYIIKHWPLHAARGSPFVEPGSDTAWKASGVYAALRKIPRKALNAWAKRFVQLVKPEAQSRNWHDATETPGKLINSLLREPWMRGTVFELPFLEMAVRMQPNNWSIWRNLGWARYNHPGYHKMPDRCALLVESQQFAVATGVGLPPETRASLIQGLGDSLFHRFEQGGLLADFAQCIDKQNDVLSILPETSPQRPSALERLSLLLEASSLLSSSRVDESTEAAIGIYREILELQPPGHVDRIETLVRLSGALEKLYEKEGDFQCLKEADSLSREALELQSPDHYCRFEALSRALSIQARIESRGTTRTLCQRYQCVGSFSV